MNQNIIAMIDAEIANLQSARALMLGNSHMAIRSAGPKRRILSPEARARIAAAQKRRWATAKATTKKQNKKVTRPVKANQRKTRKPVISSEVRAQMSARMKERWAKKKKAVQAVA